MQPAAAGYIRPNILYKLPSGPHAGFTVLFIALCAMLGQTNHKRTHSRELACTPPYRKRASQACERCRSTKRRCDDHWPQCASCTRANVTCSRSIQPRIPADPEKYIQRLEDRCSGLETQLRLLEAACDRTPWYAPPLQALPVYPAKPRLEGICHSACEALEAEPRTPSPTSTPLRDVFFGPAAFGPDRTTPLSWDQFAWL